ncbi:oligopeptide ABC transporter ATP-binding protein OppF [Clostridia bacterium]|nr:oligopeptide ABC transporter ATP-binding protein OppF [Clostridia bacterium]
MQDAMLLRVQNLKAYFCFDDQELHAVDDVSFTVREGETLGIVGESGCGKSVSCMSILHLNPTPPTQYRGGSILFHGENILEMDKKRLQKLRGGAISVIFQEPMTALNPVHTIGNQLMEALTLHRKVTKVEAKQTAIEYLRKVKIPNPENIMISYPFSLSGGMRQRVVIAMALIAHPQIIIADEPTTALDVTIQAQILDLINELKHETGAACIFISHDLGAISEMADRVIVMYGGKICEQADKDVIFSNPRHPYTRSLIQSRPSPDTIGSRLHTIPGNVPSLKDLPSGCPFHPRCEYATKQCAQAFPPETTLGSGHTLYCWHADATVSAWSSVRTQEFSLREPSETHHNTLSEILVNVENLQKHFPVNRSMFRGATSYVHAVDNVTFQIRRGHVLGLVGESGCGKSTLGRLLLGFYPVTAGKIWFDGQDASKLFKQEGSAMEHALRRRIQMIFQDPHSSMDPHMRIYDIISEGIQSYHLTDSRAQAKERVDELLRKCGLFPDQATRYPHQFSGGQKQRVCIARALAANPEFIVCDEAVSALDVSIQAQILNLLKDLRNEFTLTYLFISHDLNVVRFMSDEIAVMYLGEIVEYGSKDQIFEDHRHPYTEALFSAIPAFSLQERAKKKRVLLEGDIPSPINPPSGCRFADRCRYVKAECRQAHPALTEVDTGHFVMCARV